MTATKTRMTTPKNNDTTPEAKMHLPLLFWGTFLMIALSLLPFVLARPNTNHADHNLAMLTFWSMSAALVRGFGFIPRWRIPRYLLGGWAAIGSALTAVLLWGLSGGFAMLKG